jgi:hypothetical protein
MCVTKLYIGLSIYILSVLDYKLFYFFPELRVFVPSLSKVFNDVFERAVFKMLIFQLNQRAGDGFPKLGVFSVGEPKIS